MKIDNSCVKQTGQAMIEYTIVLAFGVLTLTTGPMQDVIATLTQRIHDHYEGYSYAISMSDIPDADNPIALDNLYTQQDLPDELRIYLTDFPDGFVSSLGNSIPTFPNLTSAIDNVNIADSFLP